MIGYRFLPPAEEEMTEASLFYEAESSGLGLEFLDDVQRVVDALCEHPKFGPSVGLGLRRALLRRFPFSLIYSEQGDTILVVAVAHLKVDAEVRTRKKKPLRRNPIARRDSVLLVSEDGASFVLEEADDFDREVAQLGSSEKFMRFLKKLSKQKGVISIEQFAKELNSKDA